MSRKLFAMIIAMIAVLALIVAIPFATTVAADETVTSLAGSGTEEDPYLIGTKAELKFLVDNYAEEAYVGKYYKMTADIKWSDYDGDPNNIPTDGDNWTPIGLVESTSASEAPFVGTFDGNGFAIYGIYQYGEKYAAATPGNYDGGVFGYVDGTIKNLAVKNSYFAGRRPCGIAYSPAIGKSLTIRNCANFATIGDGTSGYIGGIVALVNDATASIVIDRCVNFGTINGLKTAASTDSHAGGIIGALSKVKSATIKMCANYGDVNGARRIGGIAGVANSEKKPLATIQSTGHFITISDCYNGGHIDGIGVWAGGIVGLAYNGVIIKKCINTGGMTVASGSGYRWGGIIGESQRTDSDFNNKGVDISDCYLLDEPGLNKYTKNSFNVDTSLWGKDPQDGKYGWYVVTAEELKTLKYTDRNAIADPDDDVLLDMLLDKMVWTTDTEDGYPTIKTITVEDLWAAPITYYTYVFLTADYQLLDTGVLAEGSVIPTPEVPVVPSTPEWVYNFTGWSGYTDGMTIYDNVVFQATYEQVENPNNLYDVEGNGTAESPYLVGSAAALDYVAAAMLGKTELVSYTGDVVTVVPAVNLMGSYVTLTADINWGEYKTDETNNWVPLGTKTNVFRGVFDGQGHSISGLRVYEGDIDGQGEGLFAAAGKGAVIKNTIIKDSIIATGDYVSAFVGQAAQGGTLTIDNCVSYATLQIASVKGTRMGAMVAGVANDTAEATITNCVNYGTLTSIKTGTDTAFIGGIVGNLGTKLPLTIDSCANFGDIILADNHITVGGIAGQISTKDGTEGVSVTNCYNAGNIEAGRMAAGIVGCLYTDAIMQNCYNVGKVTITGQEYKAVDDAGNTDPVIAKKYASQVDNFVGDLEWGTTATNSYHLAGLATCTSQTNPVVADGGVAVLEGVFLIPTKHTGTVIAEADMQGASAVANMKFDADVWQTTTGYPTLKGITIVDQYNGEYQDVEAGGATITTEQPPVTETTPPVTETTAPVTETTAPVTETTAPVTETTAPVTETTTPPVQSDSNATLWIIIAVVAVVVVAGVVVFFVIKKK